MSQTYRITSYPNSHEYENCKEKAYTWCQTIEMLDAFAKKAAPEKDKAPAIGFFRLKRQRSGKQAGQPEKRDPKNVGELDVLALDYDKGSEFDVVTAAWCDGPYYAHTTSSQTGPTDDKVDNRVRVYVPLSRPVRPDEYRRLHGWAGERSAAMGVLGYDVTGKDVHRVFVLPHAWANIRTESRGDDNCGVLDVDRILGVHHATTANGEPLSEEYATFEHDKELDVGKGKPIVTVKEFYDSARVGERLRIHCPETANSSEGCAFAVRVRGGVRVVCTSASHGHPASPQIWHFGVSALDIPARAVVDKLLATPTGIPKPIVANAITVLSHDGRFTGLFRKDRFTGRIITTTQEAYGATKSLIRTVTREMQDKDVTWMIANISRIYKLDLPKETAYMAVDYAANEQSFDSLTASVLALPAWDNVPRLETWLIQTTGCADTALHRLYSRKFLVQMLARAMDPGCKADACLVLTGKQNAGKSTMFEILAGKDRFTDVRFSVDDPKSYTGILAGRWVVELAELANVRRSELEAVKNFLTVKVDRTRMAYARCETEHPRRCVFGGTTNSDTFLSDPSGSRRFWPVRTADVLDLEWLRNNRDQLVAEALVAYQAGERWFLDATEDADREQAAEEYQEVDPWEPAIRSFLSGQSLPFTTTDVLESLGDDEATIRVTKAHEMRAAAVLTGLKCVRRMVTPAGKPRGRYWSAPAGLVSTTPVVGEFDLDRVLEEMN